MKEGIKWKRYIKIRKMVEISKTFYSIRVYYDKLRFSDLFKAIYFENYLGKGKIPFYYKRFNGHTIMLDLTQTEDEIMSGMKSNTRNEVRRAEREGCTFSYNQDYEAFIPFYNDFSYSKGLNDYMHLDRLKKYKNTLITKVSHNGKVLAMHATAFDEDLHYAYLLYSCSPRLDESIDKKMVGWANRYLHYMDFKLFKSMGYIKYDWSGVCMDESKPDRYRIGQFKASFGGEPVETITLMTPLFVLMNTFKSLAYNIIGILKKK